MQKPRGVLLGILLVASSGLVLSSMDTIAKVLSGSLPVIEIVWARYFFHTVVMTGYLGATTGTRFLKSERPVLQVVRGTMLLIGTVLMYFALSKVPLAEVTAVQFSSPVMVTVLSVLFLGERIGLPRILAVLAGFGGVLLITRPGFAGTDPYLFLPLGAAVVFSVYFLLTRTLSGPQDAASTLFNTTAVGSIVLTALVPFVWVAPTLPEFVLMVAIGTLGALGHFCIVKGFSFASASTLSPFLYSQVLFASLYSIFLIGDPLRWNMVVGALVLVASGLFIWWRENRRRPDLQPADQILAEA